MTKPKRRQHMMLSSIILGDINQYCWHWRPILTIWILKNIGRYRCRDFNDGLKSCFVLLWP